MIGAYIGIGAGSVLALLLAVLIIRALCFKPKAQDAVETVPVAFDKEAAVTNLQQLVQCKTISYNDAALEDDAEFEKLIDLLPQLYPEFSAACPLQRLPNRALLFKWTGKASDKPCVMMSHYDVVPVVEEMWEKPPFAGIIEDGVLLGAIYYFMDDGKLFLNGFASSKHHFENLYCLKLSSSWFNCDIYAEAQNRASALCLLRCGFKRVGNNLFCLKNKRNIL